MAKSKMFYQCDLEQGTGRDKAYIEERGAVVGRKVELGGPGTGDFWTVTNVAHIGLSEENMKKLQDRSHQGWAKSVNI